MATSVGLRTASTLSLSLRKNAPPAMTMTPVETPPVAARHRDGQRARVARRRRCRPPQRPLHSDNNRRHINTARRR
ncbi:hypothetical protein PG987_015387 [Apiospora arundinis]